MTDRKSHKSEKALARKAAEAEEAQAVDPAQDASKTSTEEAAVVQAQESASASLAKIRQEALDDMRSWYKDYHALSGNTPVEDISRLRNRFNLDNAHPAGMSQFMVKKTVKLNSLFRNNSSLKAADRQLYRVLDEQEENQKSNGVAFISLCLGVATWDGHRMPVAFCPITVARPEDTQSLFQAEISITGSIELNASYVQALEAVGVHLEVQEIMDGFEYSGVLEESRKLYAAMTEQVGERLPHFAIERSMIIGNFIQTSTLVLNDTRTIINQEIAGASGNPTLDALAGVDDARQALKERLIPDFRPYDGDPHDEMGVGDVDNETRYVAQAATSGQSMVLEMPSNKDASEEALAIATRAAMSGRTVLYAPGVSAQKRRFIRAAASHAVANLVMDISDDGFNESIDRQLIAAVGFQKGSASSIFEQTADELVGVRARLSRYLGDLHGKNKNWDVSAYETLENLARISALPMHPSTRVRLSTQTAHAMIGHEKEWCQKLIRLGELGGYLIGPDDTAWYGAALYSEDEAIAAYKRVVDLLDTLLPQTREQIERTVETCGFPIAQNVQDWSAQVTVLTNLRRVLDIFQPAIFERDIDAMIEATRSKEDRKKRESKLGYWERHRLTKEAKSLLRPGAHVESLHDALVIVAEQAAQWRRFVPRGGWPVLPNKLDEIVETQEVLERDITALDAVLAPTPERAGLERVEFAALETRLRKLFDDHRALDTLPERAYLLKECADLGLGKLVDDFRARELDKDTAPAELLLSWWATVFEDIMKSSPIISNQDGATLSSVSERFVQVDTEHVRSIGTMVSQEMMGRLSEILYTRASEANQLHTLLASKNTIGMQRLQREYGDIVSAAKPIMVATPAALASSTPLMPLADVGVIDASAHLHPLELLSVLARVNTVIVLAHKETVSCPSLSKLIDLLPSIRRHNRGNARDIRLEAFLRNNGYGNSIPSLAMEDARGKVIYHYVDATGLASVVSGVVETTAGEVKKVADLIEERYKDLGEATASYRLAVVCLSDNQRLRIGAELKSRSAGHESFARFLRHVSLASIDQVAGVWATDVILSIGYGRNNQGQLYPQFGSLEKPAAEKILLDALALPQRNLDIVATITAEDMELDRIRQSGPLMLKSVLAWAQGLAHTEDAAYAKPHEHTDETQALLPDLADRIRQRGLQVCMNYGYNHGDRIPLVVGLPDKDYTLAICTDDSRFMTVPSTRQRHRFDVEDLEMLGWSVMYVWSVGMFVNPDKEVDRIVAYLANSYDDKLA